jgi:Domain of unknown function (DUF4282)
MSSPIPPHPDSGFVSGFFAGLVDFRFTKFIGPRVLSVIYTLAFALVVIGALFFFFGLLARGGAGALAAIIIVPIGTVLYLTVIRLMLEVYSSILRTAENTARTAQLLEAQLTGVQPAQSPYGGQPSYGNGGYGQPPAASGYSQPPASGGYSQPPAPGGYGQPPAPGGYGPPASPPGGDQYPYGAS